MTLDEEVATDIKRIVRLLTVLVTKEMSQKDQISTLSSAGFAPREIADLIGTTPNTVSVALSALRRAGGRKRATGRAQP